MRLILLCVAAGLVFLGLCFIGYVAVNTPAAVHLLLIDYFAEKCVPPERTPVNAGSLVVADLRAPGNGRLFSDMPIDDWVGEKVAAVRHQTDPARDLIVYVHGYHTSEEAAVCMGRTLQADLAGLPTYAAKKGPDVLVFGWPGEFLIDFVTAQDNATRAATYLEGILQAFPERQVLVVAHSLGAHVAMTAVAKLPSQNNKPQIAGMLLVEGAIPAVSIRTWHSVMTTRYPGMEILDTLRGKSPRQPIVTDTAGSGSFVTAAAKIAHLVVTTAGADVPLSDFYPSGAPYSFSDLNRPGLPSDSNGNDVIDHQAIGSPFPVGIISRSWEIRPFDASKSQSGLGVGTGVSTPDSPFAVGARYDWLFSFQVPHPSYHEIRLDRGQWWRWLHDWHGVMNDIQERRAILNQSWLFFSGNEEKANPTLDRAAMAGPQRAAGSP